MHKSTTLLLLLRGFLVDLLIVWPVHADSILIHTVLTLRTPWFVAFMASVAYSTGACALWMVSRFVLQPLVETHVSNQLGDVVKLVEVSWSCQHVFFFVAAAAAAPIRSIVQPMVVIATFCGAPKMEIVMAIFAGSIMKCSLVAHCALLHPLWLQRVGLGQELTRARCIRASSLLPI